LHYTKYFLLTAISLSTAIIAIAQNASYKVSGTIRTEKGAPLSYASVSIQGQNIATFTDVNGHYSLAVNNKIHKIILIIEASSYETKVDTLNSAGANIIANYKLQTQSLELEEVVVTSNIKHSNNSNSSIFFDRQAIEQSQAFSLKDLLNNLPGKTTTAPNVNNPQGITLRGNFGNPNLSGRNDMNTHDRNNSMGIAIIVDGMAQSNDANMQSRNLSIRGNQSGTLSMLNGYGDMDVPFQGLDLRDIPTENIEKIEVIQGVASAKYGELTDGAIIIERKAGKTPFHITTNTLKSATSFAASKGFQLSPNLGLLNVSLNLTNSNFDPRDKVKTYNRYTPGLMWTKSFGKNIKNTFSADLNYRRDQVRQDPDDESLRLSYSRNTNWSLSNRLQLTFDNIGFARKINLNLKYNEGKQDTYTQWLINRAVSGYTNKDTTGIYEGWFIPGNYIAKEQIIGAPLTALAQIHISASPFYTGEARHSVNYGLSYEYENNGGKGIVLDADRPRWIDLNGQNDRPYEFSYNPSVQNMGIYLEDQINVDIFQRAFIANIGVRGDWQNGFVSVQPRINTIYNISKQLQWNMSYGIASKAPPLVYRYPAPTWIDIPLLELYSGQVNKNLFLVFTDKIVPDNSQLKPAVSEQMEAGFKWNNKWFNGSLFGYYKQNYNQFTTQMSYQQYLLPNYTYSLTDLGISYSQTGDSTLYTGVGNYVVSNSLNSKTYGLELMLFSKKINVIATSFNVSGAYNRGSFNSLNERVIPLAEKYQQYKDLDIVYGIFPSEYSRKQSLNTKIGTVTHLPKMGFVITLSADIYWMNDTYRPKLAGYPTAYINSSKETISLSGVPLTDPIFEQFKLQAADEVNDKQRMVYGIINTSIAKEIGKNIRLTINAYNFLNLLPQHYRTTASGVVQSVNYTERVSVNAGLSFKL
jgi:ferric enterobactin receptor